MLVRRFIFLRLVLEAHHDMVEARALHRHGQPSQLILQVGR